MTIGRFVKAIASAAVLGVAAAPLSAADFIEGGDEDLGCFMTIKGQIISGDADRFRASLLDIIGEDPYSTNREFLFRFDGVEGVTVPRICLDSPGGSLAESLRMADVLTNRNGDSDYLYTSLGTAVAAGATCHSACAVLFMAGGNQSESSAGRLPNRVLHAQGSLGFHAPGLNIQDGNYSAEAVDRAFAVAVRSIGELSDRQADLRFPASLLNRMVATAPQDMYVLKTIGEASQWMIDVVGLPYPERPARTHLVNACLNAQPGLKPTAGYVQSFATRHDGKSGDYFFGKRLGGYTDSLLRRHYNRGEARIDLGRSGDFGDASLVSDPDPAEDGLNCEVTFGGRWPLETPLADNVRRLRISFLRGGFMALDQGALYPPWTRFADMSRSFGTGALPADATVWSDSRSAPTRCIVFNSSDRLTDNDPCQAVETVRFSGGGEMTVSLEFTWPSGAPTVVGMSDRLTINGNSARSDYISAASDLGEQVTCLRNSGSGNAFCFDQTRF